MNPIICACHCCTICAMTCGLVVYCDKCPMLCVCAYVHKIDKNVIVPQCDSLWLVCFLHPTHKGGESSCVVFAYFV